MIRGFILQPTYRVESRRPVVELWGRLESGESFLVRDDRTVPHFYIRANDRARAEAVGIRGWQPDSNQTLSGEPEVRLELALPADTPPIRERLHRLGIRTFEADVRFAMRFLIDRDIRGALAIDGSETDGGERLDRHYLNPRLYPGDWTPTLRVLSIDTQLDLF